MTSRGKYVAAALWAAALAVPTWPAWAKDEELSRMFACQKNLKILMLGQSDRTAAQIAERNVGGRAEFFPAIRNGETGFYGIDDHGAAFFRIPPSPTDPASGKYDLQLSLIGQCPGARQAEPSTAYASFRKDESGGIAENSLHILSDPRQKGSRDSLFARGKLKGVKAAIHTGCVSDSSARDSFAEYVAGYLAGETPPTYQDYVRKEITEDFSTFTRPRIVKTPVFNAVQRLERDWMELLRKEEGNRLVTFKAYLPANKTRPLVDGYFRSLKLCEGVEHPSVKAALKKAYGQIGRFLRDRGEPLPNSASAEAQAAHAASAKSR